MICISALVFRKINQMTAEHGPGLLEAVAGLFLIHLSSALRCASDLGYQPRPPPPLGPRSFSSDRQEKIDNGMLHLHAPDCL